MVLGMDTGGQVSAKYLLFASSRSLSSSSSIPLAMDSIKLFEKKQKTCHIECTCRLQIVQIAKKLLPSADAYDLMTLFS